MSVLFAIAFFILFLLGVGSFLQDGLSEGTNFFLFSAGVAFMLALAFRRKKPKNAGTQTEDSLWTISWFWPW